MNLKKSDIEALERKYRLNLINSITGIKPANLIGTKSNNSEENVAVFSSVVHLGSHPAQLAFILRPQHSRESDTCRNIHENGFYTINHIPKNLIKNAHYTSAKLPATDSEFAIMNIEKAYINHFFAPFVKDSPVKIGMKFSSEIPLPNGCTMIIGDVETIHVEDFLVNELGQIDLELEATVGISGLNSYYGLKKLTTFPYVRTTEIPEF